MPMISQTLKYSDIHYNYLNYQGTELNRIACLTGKSTTSNFNL